ncbi:hypothetical protein GCM10022268_28180 [Sphingomonas cynarae]|uniref:Uncharacterized protein n=1 Tax=Sphingomonas cynarae TaxID=930197 RepID=A0ABP7EEP3_9SPHN
MTEDFGATLHTRLDAMEARGRSHLIAVARRDALRDAVSIAIRIAPVAPLIFTILAFVDPLPVALVATVSLAVPLVAAAILYARRRAQIRIGRPDALALFDCGLDAKNRVAITAEFLEGPAPTGFRAAAVAEAAPWLARAQAMPLDKPAVTPVLRQVLRRRWPFVLVALLLLVLALSLHWHSGSAVTPQQMPDVTDTGRAALANGGSATSAPDDGVLASIAATLRDRLGIAASTGSAAGDPSSTAVDRNRAAGATGGVASQAGEAAAAQAAAGVGAGATAEAASGRGGAGQAGGSSGASGRDAGAVAGESSPTTDGAGSADGSRPNGDDRRRPNDIAAAGRLATTPAASARQEAAARRANDKRQSPSETGQGAPPGASGSANPPDPRAASGSRSEQGEQQRQQSSKPGEEGQQQDQGSGQSPGRGNNTPGSAQDALKRSRGLSTLMLAVPTVDRLAGTPGNAPSQVTTRRVPPQSRNAGVVAAGARGTQAGDAGLVPHRPATAHEERLVREYFRRTGPAGRQ